MRSRRRCGRPATAGRKLLVPYVTGGLGDDWAEVVRAIADAGADAIEIGIPFSDPVMDGPVIQAASEQALRGRGHARTASSTSCRGVDAGVPLVVMTYYNLAFRTGHERFAESLADSRRGRGASCPTCRSRRSGPWAPPRPTRPASRPCCWPRRPRPTSGCRRCARGPAASSTRVGLLGVTGERDDAGGAARS